MRLNSKYSRVFKWFGVALCATSCWSVQAQQAEDSSKAVGIDRSGMIARPASVPTPVQSDAVSFSELLPGTAGLQVTESGAIGAAPVMMIKGVSTINLQATPQIFVDGIPIKYGRVLRPFLSTYEPTRFGFLNPHDISSISILKDASEQGILGSRGSNGAIFIATDRGVFGGTKIDFTASTGFMRAQYNVGKLGAAPFKNYLREYFSENGATQDEISAHPVFGATPQYNGNTDWVDMVTRPARFNDYHIKLKGGSGDANYMFSIGHTGKTGTIEQSKFNRTTMRFNLDYQLSSKFEISNNLSYSNTGSRYAENGYNWGIHPLYTAVTKAPFMNQFTYNDAGVQTKLLEDVDVLGKSNPWALVDDLKNTNEENRVDGIISGKWNIQKDLALNTALSVSYYNMRESQYRPGLGIVRDQYRIRQNSNRNSSEFTLNWNFFLNKTGNWGANTKYTGQLGAWVETYEDKALYARKVNAGTDDYETLQQGTVDSASNVRFRSNLSRFYLTGQLDFFDRLAVTANINTEGSSNFGPKGRWGLYSGLNAVWDLFERSKPHQVALRASVGRSGNADVRGYYQDNLYFAVSYFGYGGVYLGNVANENIKPEVTDALDAGLRLSLFQRRLDIDAGYYYRQTSNLITFRNYPVELGLDPQFENNGRMASRGIELSVRAQLIARSKFSWDLYGNLSTLDNKVEELPNGAMVRTLGNVSGTAAPGQAVGSFYGYRVKGVFASEAAVNLKKADGTAYKPGDYIIDDLNQDGRINELDKQIIGSPMPDLFGGIGTHLRYGRISLDARLAFSYGQDIYNSFAQQLHLMSDYSNQSPEVVGRWKSDVAPGNGLSRAAYGDPSFNGVASDLWVEDGSYSRLKWVTLSYEVPLRNKTAFIKGLRFNVTGENLLTLSSYSGLDPEVVSSSDVLLRGIDFGSSPLPKAVIVGVKISL